MCSNYYQHQRKIDRRSPKHLPLEANHPILAVSVPVTISLAKAPLVTVVAAKVELLEDAGEQREVRLARMSLEEGTGVDAGGVRRSSTRYCRCDNCQHGESMHCAFHGWNEQLGAWRNASAGLFFVAGYNRSEEFRPTCSELRKPYGSSSQQLEWTAVQLLDRSEISPNRRSAWAAIQRQ